MRQHYQNNSSFPYAQGIDKLSIYLQAEFCVFFRQLRVLHRFFFFFQAEDGIRDATVTGVQTCALPIFGMRDEAQEGTGPTWQPVPVRSEERRVGKECRSRWAPYHEKKKTNKAEEE